MLYNTGIQRMAKNLLRQVVSRYLARETATIQVLHSIKTLAVEMSYAMAEGEWKHLGQLLDRHWQLNQVLDPHTNNAPITAILDVPAPGSTEPSWRVRVEAGFSCSWLATQKRLRRCAPGFAAKLGRIVPSCPTALPRKGCAFSPVASSPVQVAGGAAFLTRRKPSSSGVSSPGTR